MDIDLHDKKKCIKYHVSNHVSNYEIYIILSLLERICKSLQFE